MGRRAKQPPVAFLTKTGSWPHGPFTNDAPSYVRPIAHIAAVLVAHMRETGRSQNELARISGVNIATINHILAGKVIPDTATLAALEAKLELKLWGQ